ncbi:MAG: VWA domain-containing protein [Thermoanaerobaculaceae bacterium]|nr:VWA domain-containing protein [Thermoanaerobaculaceae bacterium]
MRWRMGWVVVLLLATWTAAAGDRARIAALPEEWRRWLEEEVYPLISSEQRRAFLSLETNEQRAAFAERLWTVWGQQLGIGAAFRREYQERLEYCRTEFGNTTEDRARAVLLHGPPDATKEIECEEVFFPLQFWQWARIEGVGQGVTVLFFKPYGLGSYRLWDPRMDGRGALYSQPGQMALQSLARSGSVGSMNRPEWRCGDAEEILRLLAAAEFWLGEPRVRAAMEHLPLDTSAGSESAAARFLEFSTVVPKGAQPLSFSSNVTVAGRRGGLVRVAFSLRVEARGLTVEQVGETQVVRFDVTGEISRAGELVDRFRYAFTLPAGGEAFPLQVERELRPGSYHARLKVAEANGKCAGVQELDFEVQAPESSATARDGEAKEVVERLAAGAEPTLSLVGPKSEGATGVQRFTALTSQEVAKVEFLLDGRPILSKNRPPFEVELDLGPLPRMATVTAVAFDAAGNELDRKHMDINVGRERFVVRLQPIGAADRQGGRVHVRAELNIPSERTLTALEVYWNESLVATLYQPPWEVWVTMPAGEPAGYLRALARLDDGAQAEDVQFVNTPTFLTGVQVDAVELPVVVVDNAGRPVEDLQEADFEVFEDGVPQTVSHFSRQQELPVRLGLVIDTSGSMEKTLPEVQRVVLGFLKNLLRPKDRAFIVAFSDQPVLLQAFTADFGLIERALIALRADRETAFYDATIYGLFQFSGVRGRKAMVVLTDGKDNVSRATFDRAMDYARRSGVILYTIGIDLPITEIKTRSQLSRLAQSTGGDAFFLERNARLERVYERIDRELRSQYLLVYTSSATTPPDRFRAVTVKVKRPGVEVRTIAGYYPAR